MSKKTADSKPWDKRFPLCEVRWLDSCGHSGWREAPECIRENHPSEALSVGYLLEGSPKRVLIAQSLDENGLTNDRMDIPRAMVIKMHYFASRKRQRGTGKKK